MEHSTEYQAAWYLLDAAQAIAVEHVEELRCPAEMKQLLAGNARAVVLIVGQARRQLERAVARGERDDQQICQELDMLADRAMTTIREYE